MSIPLHKQIRVFESGEWKFKTPQELREERNNYELVGQYEGYPLKEPYYVRKEERKPLEERISDYLDRCGVLNENMRRDITAMIREEEKE